MIPPLYAPSSPTSPAASLVESAAVAPLRMTSLALILAVPIGALLLPRGYVLLRYKAQIHEVGQAPPRPVAIVFGAGLRRSGAPTPVLADRVMAAVDLYLTGRAGRLIFSGTARGATYDEPAAMRDLAVSLGVPAEAIVLDRGGTRTLETCTRARDLFGVEQALLVSQRYHLPRALTLCEAIGIQAEGASADLRSYSLRARSFWELREIPATFVAVCESIWLRRLGSPAGRAFTQGSDGGA